MANARDWLPSRRTDQLAMAKRWSTVLATNAQQWSIQAGEVTILNNFITKAQETLNLAMSGNRSPVITAQANAAFHQLVEYMRFMKSRKFFVPPLTNVDLVSLGLHPHDTTITPIPDPTGQAEADVQYPGPHLLRLIMKPLAGTAKKPKAFWLAG